MRELATPGLREVPSDSLVPFDSVRTDEPTRRPDYQKANRVWVSLAQTLAELPRADDPNLAPNPSESAAAQRDSSATSLNPSGATNLATRGHSAGLE